VTLLADVVATSERLAATRSRTAKIAALAELLRVLEPTEVAPTVGFLTGEPRQGRVGVGWATVYRIEEAHAGEPTLTVADLDGLVDAVGGLSGPGSAGARSAHISELLRRSTETEAAFVRRLFVGELRHGALEGLMADAIARAADVPPATVRRAHMLSGDLGGTALVALTEGAEGLGALGLQLMRPLRPMLAASSPTVEAALAEVGRASVEWKLDGARIQVHRDGDEVRIYTRNLNDVTERLPEVVALVRQLPAHRLVVDGELMGLSEEDAPRLFQETMSRFGTHGEPSASGLALRPSFFDCLHVDGEDLIDLPLARRLEALTDAVGAWRIPGIVTDDPAEAGAFAEGALATGHEGVMVKAIDSPYEAGRRGKAWRKVKPVRSLDLVVLAAEWGHGRRRGWLSNLHLGARGADGDFVMVGKTFKGLTDALLTWQTEALQARRVREEGITVVVRPELVVEIALDGVQRSTRYPGGVALRFARVTRYRPDKSPGEADTIEAVQAMLAG
jgi:DNA ligase-1